MAGAAKRGAGKKPAARKPKRATRSRAHRPTPETRATVKALAGFGIPHEQIAGTLSIGGTSLRRHYPTELATGSAAANAKVIESLFMMACGSPAAFDQAGRKIREEQARVPAAAIFWAKTRMGWREVLQHEHGGTKDAPAIPLRLDGLGTAQLEQLLSRVNTEIETTRG